jgi:hypothetical protein
MGSIARFVAHAGVAWCSLCALARAEQPPAPSRAQCLASHEQAQDARLAGQLLSARRLLRECSATACPALVSRDCVGWLTDVEQQIPSVVFRAFKDGEDVATLKVSEGQQLLTDSLTGTPLELDPGPHHFVAELGGFAAQDATYVLQAGDKGRVVRFDFASPKAAPAPSSSPTPKTTPVMAPAPLPRPIPKLSYALGGVTLAATVAGSVFGALALAKRKSVEQRCAPLCRENDVRGVKELALASDISFAVALLGAGAGVYSYVSRPEVPPQTAQRLAPVRAGWSVTWTGLGVTAGGSF